MVDVRNCASNRIVFNREYPWEIREEKEKLMVDERKMMLGVWCLVFGEE